MTGTARYTPILNTGLPLSGLPAAGDHVVPHEPAVMYTSQGIPAQPRDPNRASLKMLGIDQKPESFGMKPQFKGRMAGKNSCMPAATMGMALKMTL